MTTDEALEVLRGDDRHLELVRRLAAEEQAGQAGTAVMPIALRKAKRALGSWRVVQVFLEDNLPLVRWQGAPW